MSITGAKQLVDTSSSSSNSDNMRTLDPALKNSIEKQLKEQDEALRINPLDLEAWKFKGFDLAMLHRSDEAIIAYDQAIKVNLQDLDAWYYKGVTLYRLNKDEDAIKAFDKAIEVDP
jgi:tetratricopeptide (TPR) repeat protein